MLILEKIYISKKETVAVQEIKDTRKLCTFQTTSLALKNQGI